MNYVLHSFFFFLFKSALEASVAEPGLFWLAPVFFAGSGSTSISIKSTGSLSTINIFFTTSHLPTVQENFYLFLLVNIWLTFYDYSMLEHTKSNVVELVRFWPAPGIFFHRLRNTAGTARYRYCIIRMVPVLMYTLALKSIHVIRYLYTESYRYR